MLILRYLLNVFVSGKMESRKITDKPPARPMTVVRIVEMCEFVLIV